MSLHAFVDESIRGRRYVICAVLIPVSSLGPARRALRHLRAPGQRRIHFARESDERRRAALGSIAALDVDPVVYFTDNRDQVAARARILAAMVADLRSVGVTRVVIESRDRQDDRDRSVLFEAIGHHPAPLFAYAHRRATDEPLLWIADAIAWAWGRGGTWRTRLDHLGMLPRVAEVKTR